MNEAALKKVMDNWWPAQSKAYQMLEYLAVATNMPAGAIQWGAKTAKLSRLRWAIMWALRNEYDWRWLKIARFFEMDHATVIYGVNKADKLRELDPDYRSLIDGMIKAVGNGQ